MMNNLWEQFKNSFFSIKKGFWLREYTISALCLIMIIYIGHSQNNLPFNILLLSILNAILFPFSKYLSFKMKQWFYKFIYNAELHQVYFRTGCLIIVGKVIKNLFLYCCSFIIGWIGVILILMNLEHPKESELK